MTHLEEMRQEILNRILRNCSSRAYGLAVMRQVDEYSRECVKVALSDAACELADKVGV